jgi:hypothetical protein
MRLFLLFTLFHVSFQLFSAEDGLTLWNTKPLKLEGDLSAQMIAGINRFLSREIR